MFAKTQGKTPPASSEAEFQTGRATCELSVGAMCLVEFPPFFEIEPPLRMRTFFAGSEQSQLLWKRRTKGPQTGRVLRATGSYRLLWPALYPTSP